MRRKDREILDFGRMIELVDEEEVLRLAFTDEEGTYIVPVNYGYEAEWPGIDALDAGGSELEGELCFYIHGAAEGRKSNALRAAAASGDAVPFEIDGQHLAEVANGCDASYYYMCVMGHVAVEVLEGNDKIIGLKSLMDGIMPADEYDFRDEVVEKTMLCRLTVTDWTCKKH